MKRRSSRKGKRLAETPNLPPDLIEEILSRLPVKSILRFRCVSKYWHALLTTNPNFVQKHLTHTIQNADNHSFNLHNQSLNGYFTITDPTFEKWVKLKTPFIGKKIQIRTVGSLNGLICLYHANKRTFNNVIYLWNPAIREYKTFSHPKTEQTRLGLKRPSSVGFGYNPVTNDYKVVEILSCRQNPDLLADDNDSWCEAEIYSLNANSWRRQVISDLWFHAYGEFTNGAIHWLVSPRTGKYYRSIFAFHMVDEVFREIPLPICNLPNDVIDLASFITTSLHTYKERLCVCVQYHMNQNFDVWVLKEYGIKDSWTKLLNFRHPDSVGYIDPVLFFKSGEILFRACPYYEYKLYSYNVDSGHLQKLKVLKGRDAELVPYMESLVRPVACNGVERQVNGSHRGDSAET